MGLLIGALTLGFIFSLVALGVFISFRIFAFPELPPMDQARSVPRWPRCC